MQFKGYLGGSWKVLVFEQEYPGNEKIFAQMLGSDFNGTNGNGYCIVPLDLNNALSSAWANFLVEISNNKNGISPLQYRHLRLFAQQRSGYIVGQEAWKLIELLYGCYAPWVIGDMSVVDTEGFAITYEGLVIRIFAPRKCVGKLIGTQGRNASGVDNALARISQGSLLSINHRDQADETIAYIKKQKAVQGFLCNFSGGFFRKVIDECEREELRVSIGDYAEGIEQRFLDETRPKLVVLCGAGEQHLRLIECIRSLSPTTIIVSIGSKIPAIYQGVDGYLLDDPQDVKPLIRSLFMKFNLPDAVRSDFVAGFPDVTWKIQATLR